MEEIGDDVIRSERFRAAWSIRHHRDNVALHSLYVARESCRIASWLSRHGVSVSVEDAVRASLLHDIGMTDNGIFRSPGWKKAYSHPTQGADVAEKEYHVNEVQADAIRRHMWPICIIPPKHVEGWVISMADKISSAKELLP